MGKDFFENFRKFFGLLNDSSSDYNLRYLALKLDFNEYYKNEEYKMEEDFRYNYRRGGGDGGFGFSGSGDAIGRR